jgi:uncharacterized oxidoreductase
MTAGRGKGKVSPDKVAEELVLGLKKDKKEIYIGKAKIAKFIGGLSSSLLDKILKSAIFFL